MPIAFNFRLKERPVDEYDCLLDSTSRCFEILDWTSARAPPRDTTRPVSAPPSHSSAPWAPTREVCASHPIQIISHASSIVTATRGTTTPSRPLDAVASRELTEEGCTVRRVVRKTRVHASRRHNTTRARHARPPRCARSIERVSFSSRARRHRLARARVVVVVARSSNRARPSAPAAGTPRRRDDARCETTTTRATGRTRVGK